MFNSKLWCLAFRTKIHCTIAWLYKFHQEELVYVMTLYQVNNYYVNPLPGWTHTCQGEEVSVVEWHDKQGYMS